MYADYNEVLPSSLKKGKNVVIDPEIDSTGDRALA